MVTLTETGNGIRKRSEPPKRQSVEDQLGKLGFHSSVCTESHRRPPDVRAGVSPGMPPGCQVGATTLRAHLCHCTTRTLLPETACATPTHSATGT